MKPKQSRLGWRKRRIGSESSTCPSTPPNGTPENTWTAPSKPTSTPTGCQRVERSYEPNSTASCRNYASPPTELPATSNSYSSSTPQLLSRALNDHLSCRVNTSSVAAVRVNPAAGEAPTLR